MLERPLSSEQILYAAHDVTYLRDIFPIFREKLEANGRFAWVLEESATLQDRSFYEADVEALGHKFRFLSRKWQPPFILKRLLAWREAKAVAFNKPRGHILDDAILNSICNDPHCFQPHYVLHSFKKNYYVLNFDGKDHYVARFNASFWEKNALFESFQRLLGQIENQIKNVSDTEKACILKKLHDDRKRSQFSPLEEDPSKRIFLKNWVQKCALENEIDPALFASRTDMDLLLEGFLKYKNLRKSHSRLSKGWRRELLKNFFEQHKPNSETSSVIP